MYTPERRGHGRAPDVAGPFTYPIAQDSIVFLDEVVGGPVHRAIPDAEPPVLPGTSHVLVMEKPHRVQELVPEFLTADPAPTILPIRRARR